MKLIQIWGGPGIGKSTTAAEVFARLKKLDHNAELVNEFAKQLTWNGRFTCLSNQFYVNAKQYHKMFILKDQVDFIVTDSPLMLGAYYNRIHSNMPKCFEETLFHLHNTFDDQLNVFLTRSKKYNPKGRNQSEEEARAIDNALRDIMREWQIPYIELGEDAAYEIVKMVTR
jgi:hypothetical protein